jgi:phosphate transport system permease protein
MTDVLAGRSLADPAARARLSKRHRAERRFKYYGLAAIFSALAILSVLLITIVGTGYTAFQQTYMQVDIDFRADVIDPQGTRHESNLRSANYAVLVREALLQHFPDVEGRRDRRELTRLVSSGADIRLLNLVLKDPSLIGTQRTIWVKASADLDSFVKGQIPRDVPEDERKVSDQQIGWIDALAAKGLVEKRFNFDFFTSADSREPEQAGVLGAVMGSLLTLIVTLVLSFPVAVMAAIYLEEFAPKNRITDFIEININNLAAVPSIVFGLLGLAVFLGVFGMPRSAPLVGGMVLALMTMPTIIIAARAALKAVPPSIREAALGMGASPIQTATHHVLPLAMPGILTGTIIGMAQALGETAPLLMIGMVAFIVDVPGSFTDAATVLPVQVYLWADAPERGFVERTSAAIMVLLAFLIAMNILAVFLRRRFERRW